MKIRQATKKDLKNYLKIQKQAFPKTNIKREAKFFDLKLKSKGLFVVEVDGEYAGHLAFGKHLIEPPFARSVFVEELAISKGYRKQGLGKKLIEHLIDYCKKSKVKIIYTATGDYRGNKSHGFYKKLGFKKIGSLKNILPDDEYDYGQVFYGRIVR